MWADELGCEGGRTRGEKEFPCLAMARAGRGWEGRGAWQTCERAHDRRRFYVVFLQVVANPSIELAGRSVDRVFATLRQLVAACQRRPPCLTELLLPADDPAVLRERPGAGAGRGCEGRGRNGAWQVSQEHGKSFALRLKSRSCTQALGAREVPLVPPTARRKLAAAARRPPRGTLANGLRSGPRCTRGSSERLACAGARA